VFHDQVIANGVELIEVVAGRVGGIESFVQLQIEDQKPQTEGVHAFCGG
jgi:hypothetical protein